MKFSEQWLREWVNPPIDTAALIEQLTMAGLEVDALTPASGDFTGVVIGQVLSLEPHPNADKLKVCQVDIGQTEPLTVVCGANNVRQGMKAPTALIGADLAGFKIKPSKLRGVESFGMLCSTEELGLSDKAQGLMVLPDDAPIGHGVRDYLQLNDHCIEVDLTANRGDCASIIGIAREVGALNGCDLRPVTIKPHAAQTDCRFEVNVVAPQACPHYVGRVITGINSHAPTPLWMQERLRRSGLRSISLVVDVTNYVLLELGQPMHGFDWDKLHGKITVRHAQQGEQLTLLDEQTVTLDERTLVIADDKAPLALAGIMGGLASAIDDKTCNIFLESAFFNPELLMGCARRYGLSTDSSYRFERGVDPNGQLKAMERATALLLAYAGGQAGAVVEVSHIEHLPKRHSIVLRTQQIKRLLGQAIDVAMVEDSLRRLGMVLTREKTAEGWQWRVIPPSFRFDIAIEADLIEEIARIYGYNRLDQQAGQTAVTMQQPANPVLAQLRAAMVERGYYESISYSFGDPVLLAKLLPETTGIKLKNPLSGDLSVMRPTLWMGLLPALSYNQKRQQPRVRLFETGLRFGQTEDKIEQIQSIAGIITGFIYAEQWGAANRLVDFFDLKADVENIARFAQGEIRFVRTQHLALHPEQCAAILRNNKQIGILGRLHPRLMDEFAFKQPVYLFEMDLLPLLQQPVVQFSPLSKFPSIRRDLAVVVDEALSAQSLIDCIQQNGSEWLVQLQLFDIYRGTGIEQSKKSLALGLTFRTAWRNLTEADIDPVIENILTALKNQFNASLRK